MAIAMTVRVLSEVGRPCDTEYKAVEHVPCRGDTIAIPTKADPYRDGRIEAVYWDEPKGIVNALSCVTIEVRPLLSIKVSEEDPR